MPQSKKKKKNTGTKREAPDFRKRFSRPPKGPHVKGGLVQLVLEERGE
jgi:hypothetical protein